MDPRQVLLLFILLLSGDGFVLVVKGKGHQDRVVVSQRKPCPEKGKVRDLNGNCVKRFVLPERKRCDESIRIRFGMTEVKLGGRMLSLECEEGWRPAPPNDYAMCKLGKWDRDIPMCVRPGCEPFPLSMGEFWAEKEMDGALTRFHCKDLGHEIVGQPVLGCDGEFWNGTAPSGCRLPTTTTTTTTPSPLRKSRLNKDISTEESTALAVKFGCSPAILMLSLMAAASQL